jgi:MYXO-CTERM domain-containing protein
VGIYTTTIDTSSAEPGVHSITVTAVVGNEVRSDSIQVNLTSGPCGPLADAGPDGDIDADIDAGPDADIDSAPDVDAPDPDAGADAPTQDGPVDAEVETDADEPSGVDAAASNDGGCSCGVPGPRPGDVGGIGALLALALVLVRRRR